MPEAVFEIWLPAPRDTVWADHACPGALQTMTPKIGRLQMIVPDEGLIEGRLIHFRLVFAGIPFLVWKGRYERVEPPRLFHDVALQSPYRSWSHVHRFVEQDGGSLIRDEISYQMKFGPLGPLADALVARPLLNALFKYRHQCLRAMYIK